MAAAMASSQSNSAQAPTQNVAAAKASTEPAKPAVNSSRPQGIKLSMPTTTADTIRNAHQHTDVFSPVNQNGSFEFDRVIKAGEVRKRTRKTKAWKPVHLVLRPNQLSFYKDSEGTKLRHQIALSDLTAVARQRDPKHKSKPVFGLFSPERNFHIEAASEKDASEWVELIRQEARIDEEEEEMILMSPHGTQAPFNAFTVRHSEEGAQGGGVGGGTSSSEPEGPGRRSVGPASLSSMRGRQPQQQASQYPPATVAIHSGNEAGSFSDFSDTGFFPDSSLSLSNTNTNTENARPQHSSSSAGVDAIYRPNAQRPAMSTRTVSQMSVPAGSTGGAAGAGAPSVDDERVIYQGRLYLLQSKAGVRAWKLVWAVLRPKALALYKNEDEYAALLVIPLASVQGAVEIDPPSTKAGTAAAVVGAGKARPKEQCFQVIAEERNWRFCARDEDGLARWLGAFKSLLAKRKEGRKDFAPAVLLPDAPVVASPQALPVR